jgi:hypothetical protein
VAVENQPFPSAVNGNATKTYLDVRIEPHFEDDEWIDLFPFNNFTYADKGHWYSEVSAGDVQWSGSSTYTVIQLGASSYQTGYEIDVQVQASIGYYYTYSVWDYQNYQEISVQSFFAQQSGWSPTQTITIPSNSTSIVPPPPNQTENPTPTQTSTPTTSLTLTPTSTPATPEFPALATLPLFAALILVSIVIERKRIRNASD